jgi:homoserine O-acetyltransferase/O-succinyltransferase
MSIRTLSNATRVKQQTSCSTNGSQRHLRLMPLYQWDSSRDYDPSPGVERIKTAVLAINSADDERNPPETGIMERELKRIKNVRFFLIPTSEDTRGHLTTVFAKFSKQQLQELLQTVPHGAL